jgi:hypothetical protein
LTVLTSAIESFTAICIAFPRRRCSSPKGGSGKIFVDALLIPERSARKIIGRSSKLDRSLP